MGKGGGEMKDRSAKTMKDADIILSSIRSRLRGTTSRSDGGKGPPTEEKESAAVVPFTSSEVLSERDVMGRELRNMADELKATDCAHSCAPTPT